MTVIKRSSADQLRNGAPKGRKVMLIWDKAIDCPVDLTTTDPGHSLEFSFSIKALA